MELFSEHSIETIGFDSTWETKNSIKLFTSEVQTDALPKKEDKQSATNEHKNVGIQTEFQCSATTVFDDKVLAQWLNKIYPIIKKELLKGVTNVIEFDDSTSVTLSGYYCQSLNVGKHEEGKNIENLLHGAAAWLSLCISDAPLLVVSGSPIHNTWCDHTTASVHFYYPKRNKTNDKIVYEELEIFTVKSCIEILSTNVYNKDMVAGGTISGDLYIWQYKITNEPSGNITELYSDSSQFGSIIGIAWMKSKSIVSAELLTCHKDGHIVLWKIGKQMIRDKIFLIQTHDSLATLSAIIGISSTEFIVGTDKGKLLLCSISQASQLSNSTNAYDPVINELENHILPISCLFEKIFKNRTVIISSDISGELYFHQIDDTDDQPGQIIKMPLPFKSKIVISADCEHVLSPGSTGSLDIFTINSALRKNIPGIGNGSGDNIVISDNGYWVITGCYEGIFQLFRLNGI